jgi:hypothetical protein
MLEGCYCVECLAKSGPDKTEEEGSLADAFRPRCRYKAPGSSRSSPLLTKNLLTTRSR